MYVVKTIICVYITPKRPIKPLAQFSWGRIAWILLLMLSIEMCGKSMMERERNKGERQITLCLLINISYYVLHAYRVPLPLNSKFKYECGSSIRSYWDWVGPFFASFISVYWLTSITKEYLCTGLFPSYVLSVRICSGFYGTYFVHDEFQLLTTAEQKEHHK